VSAELAISIVLYQPSLEVLEQTLVSLNKALGFAKRKGLLRTAKLFLVDNSLVDMPQLSFLLKQSNLTSHVDVLETFSGHGNIGYGAGHNRAIYKSDCDFHLILNPDTVLDEHALFVGLHFMRVHPEAGLITPSVTDGKGKRQYLCKNYPAVFDLLLRGFAPTPIKTLFRKRLNHYEMRDVTDTQTVWDIPIVSGCFMLARSSVLFQVKGFAPAYFLYFEDFDLSLRIARFAHVVYVPEVRIIHFGGNAARKGWRHIGFFIQSAVIFFNQHGWKWF
jgi:GT2 family glycosyltransferase